MAHVAGQRDLTVWIARAPAVFALQSGRADTLRLARRPVTACTADVDIYREPDLGNDDELAMIDSDNSAPAQVPEDVASAVTVIAKTACTKQRFLHIANYSFVGELKCL